MNLVIIGASGLAREVFDLANTCYGTNPDFKIKGFLSDGPSNIEEMGYPKVLNTVAGYTVEKDDVFVCSIGDVDAKKANIQTIINNVIPPQGSCCISPTKTK